MFGGGKQGELAEGARGEVNQPFFQAVFSLQLAKPERLCKQLT
jgi:hypothetical protein